MNKASAHLSPVIDFGVESVRGNHDPDCPVVVPLDKSQPNPTGHIPFAAILALDPNDRLAREPRLCIHVFMDEHGISFGDGIFAIRSAYPTITSPVPFRPLCEALRKDRREWSPLLNIKIGEKPHLHVKNWQEEDKAFKLTEQQLGAAACLRILNRWNSWEAANETWQNRMFEIVGHATFTGEHIASDVSRAENKFQKLCNGFALEKGKEQDDRGAFAALHACLTIAAKV